LLNIGRIFPVVLIIALATYDCLFSPIPSYYVKMQHNPTTPTNNHERNQLVVDLNNVILELDDLIVIGRTQGTKRLVNLLSLPILLVRKRYGKEPLVDYSNAHVVTLD
jgi:hypothetical protein